MFFKFAKEFMSIVIYAYVIKFLISFRFTVPIVIRIVLSYIFVSLASRLTMSKVMSAFLVSRYGYQTPIIYDLFNYRL